MKLIVLLFVFMSSLSYATCISICRDTDAGKDPEYAGAVIQELTCAAPGRPARTTTDYFFDKCHEGVLTENFCGDGTPEGQGPQTATYPCKKCSESRMGVCEEF